MSPLNINPLLPIAALLLTTTVAAVENVDYARDVKPILKARCYACHGALKQKARLRLDTGVLLRKGGRDGPSVEPGDSAAKPSDRARDRGGRVGPHATGR